MIRKAIHQYNRISEKVKASLWFMICSFLQRGISVITTPIFTRLLNTTEYGKYNVFNSWLGIVAIFVSLRLSYGVYSQGLVKFEEDRKRFSSSMQGINLTLCAAWTIGYLVSRPFWNQLLGLTTVQMLAMLVMVWTTNVFEFWSAEQRVCYSYKKLVLVTIAVSLAKPLLGILLVVNANDKVTARILGLMLVELVAYTGLFCLQLLRGKQFFSRKYWRYSVLFNLPLIPHYLSQTVLNNSDRIMISNMVGESEAGIYSLAYSLAMLMMLVSNSLSHTITPWIFQKIKQRKITDIPEIIYTSLVIMASVNLLLIAFAPEIVRIFAPVSYYGAIWIIPPVAMSVYFIFCYDIFAKFAFYYEKTTHIMVASSVGAILNIALNYVFIKAFGYIAAGYTTLICYMIYVVMHYALMRKIIKAEYGMKDIYQLKTICVISIGFLALGFIYLLSYSFIWLRYLLTLAIALLCVRYRRTLSDKIKSVIYVKKAKVNS